MYLQIVTQYFVTSFQISTCLNCQEKTGISNLFRHSLQPCKFTCFKPGFGQQWLV